MRAPLALSSLYIVPNTADVFSRVRGIFETDILHKRNVCILGVGSGGSFIARELAKCGIGSFTLIDSDRLELGNVTRHECGVRDLGRLKVNCVRDLIIDHHPAAKVYAAAIHISGNTREIIRKLISDSDVVICATDNRESRLIINRICIQEQKPVIFGGVFLRAVGGQVLRVIPELTPCYQCFITALPMEAANNEISSVSDAARLDYTDRPMPIEPGLSSDLIPVALHIVKLALVELLRDSTTSLSSLREDLAAPWYMWINRRDPKTIYATWEPLADNIDGMRILRWYGIVLARDPLCPACGIPGQQEGLDEQFFAKSE
jgi:molybdopterin/thiamine biosynthesis adenylyltransferase